MRIFIWSILIITFAPACKKNAATPIEGIVIGQGGASGNSYWVEIKDPESRHLPFFCDSQIPEPPVGHYNCHNSVFITNLPDALKDSGTNIVFSRYKNFGPNPIWSSNTVPRDIEVYDARKQ